MTICQRLVLTGLAFGVLFGIPAGMYWFVELLEALPNGWWRALACAALVMLMAFGMTFVPGAKLPAWAARICRRAA